LISVVFSHPAIQVLDNAPISPLNQALRLSMSWITIDNANTMATEEVEQDTLNFTTVICLEDFGRSEGHYADGNTVGDVYSFFTDERPEE